MEYEEMMDEKKKIRCVGETMHVLQPAVERILAAHDGEAVSRLVQRQLDGGADGLEINLGPAREMRQHLPWLLAYLEKQTTAELFLWADVLQEAELLKNCHLPITINAVTADPEELRRSMDLAMRINASLVVLLVRPGMESGNVEEQLLLAVDVLTMAEGAGFPLTRLFLDPVLACRYHPVQWRLGRGLPDMNAVITLLGLLPELGYTEFKTIVGLSNGTPGLTGIDRSRVQGRIVSALTAAGLDAVICNCRDAVLMNHISSIAMMDRESIEQGQQLAA